MRRIKKLEENYFLLQEKYDQLVIVVNQNKEKCDSNKREQDDQINETRNHFENYRQEIDQYRRETTTLIAQLQEKINRLNRQQELLDTKQNEHGIAISDLTLQREILAKLSLEIEQIINARREDINRLDQFSQKLDHIGDLFNQVRDVLGENNSVTNNLQEIRKLFLGQKLSLDKIELRVQQIEENILTHNERLTASEERLNNFKVTVQKLDQRMNVLENDLRSINEDLNNKTLQINQTNALASDAVQQVNDLRGLIDAISGQLASLKQSVQNLEQIMARLQTLENRPFDPSVQAMLDELNSLKTRVSDLEQATAIVTPDPETANDTNYEELFQKIREIVSSILQFREEINVQINDLKTQLEQLLSAQKKEQPKPSPPTPTPAREKGKIIPYLESLPPIDLLDNIWI